MINPFGFVLTLGLFKAFEYLKKYKFLSKVPPIFSSGIFLILILKIFHVDFEIYNESARYITYMLIPATVALGYPIYKHVDLLVKNKRIIYFAFLGATVIAIVSTYIIAELCKADNSLVISMLPKSVTAPIAVEISRNLGGIPELTACIVVLTGVFGAVLGHKILEFIHVRNDVAIGLSIGAASHVIGTSRCIEKGRENQIVMSSVAFVIVGILSAVIAPLFVFLIHG